MSGTVAVKHLPELERWLKGHFRKSDDKKFHAFSNQGPPSLKPNSKDEWEFEIDITVGPVTVQIRGCINLLDFSVTLEIYILIPLHPAFLVVKVSGNLRDGGITIEFSVPPTISGWLKIYLTEFDGFEWITIDFCLTIFGDKFEIKAFRLLPLLTK